MNVTWNTSNRKLNLFQTGSKHRFHFEQVMRRGIENVRAELLEKALTYNFCKMIELKKRQLKQAA